jgi:hypothetical protein
LTVEVPRSIPKEYMGQLLSKINPVALKV